VNTDSCAIEELLLQEGHITGFQIQQFISPSRPTLTYLRLFHVSGINNHEFSTFLLHASSTLCILFITGCTIPRDNEDDEYAIDASMSKMVCLTDAQIEGPGLASGLAIKRKPQNFGASPTGRITVSHAIGSDMGDIVDALETTTWSSIYLLHVKMAGWTSGLRERTYDMARSRGISFDSHH
jgi:hypothetical protein